MGSSAGGTSWPTGPELANCKSVLNEVHQKYPSCGGPEYNATRNAGSNEAAQFSCSLTCPSIVNPTSQAVVLDECTFQAEGRTKKESEQRCAFLASTHLSKAAPTLGVQAPAASAPAGVSAPPAWGVDAASAAAAAIGRAASTDSDSDVDALDAVHSHEYQGGRELDPAEVDGMSLEELKQALMESVQREVRLKRVLASIGRKVQDGLAV